jgi:RNA polymerase sigma-70 factor (ECF subfamily)
LPARAKFIKYSSEFPKAPRPFPFLHVKKGQKLEKIFFVGFSLAQTSKEWNATNKETDAVTERQLLEIYQETVNPLYGYMARRTGGNRALTEDIVQESYLRALDHWKRKAAPNSPLAWLKRVARNILIDYLRQKRWINKADLDHNPDSGNRTSEDQFRSLEIYSAISSLGRKKAKILESFYYDGMSVKEIAGEMAISERAVEGQLRRARRSLKSLLPEIKSNGGHDE